MFSPNILFENNNNALNSFNNPFHLKYGDIYDIISNH